MKILLFLLAIFAIVALVIRNLQKTREKEALARRQAMELRKQKEKESLTPEAVMIWPVVGIKREDKAASEEPSMTSIEYETPAKTA